MSKNPGRRTRRSPGEPSAADSVRSLKHGRSRAGPTADRETATGQRDRTLLASGLRRIAAQALRRVRMGRFRAAVADAHQLVPTHPAAVF